MWAAFFVLTVVVIAAGWLWVHDSTRRIERAEFGICHRLQVVRDNTNRNGAVIYEGIRAFVRSPSLDRAAKTRLGRLLEVPQYQGPTNCQVAVDAPESYRAPTPRPYSEVPVRLLHRQLRLSPDQ